MRRMLVLSILVLGLMVAGQGVALAQEKSTKDVHVDFGWKSWFLTVYERGGNGNSGPNSRLDGIMAGPTLSLDMDRKWTLAAAYLSTTLGKNIDQVQNPTDPSQQTATRRSDLDVTLRHRVTDWLGAYLNFKRLDFEQGQQTGSGINRGSIQGIGFGFAGAHPVWAPTRDSSVYLTGTATWLPLAWTDFVTATGCNTCVPGGIPTFRAKPNWTNIEAGVGYSHGLDPVVVSVIAAYRYQYLTLETEGVNSAGGGLGRDFANVHVAFYGPTVALNIHW